MPRCKAYLIINIPHKSRGFLLVETMQLALIEKNLEVNNIFQEVDSNLIDDLINKYANEKQEVKEIASIFQSQLKRKAIKHFIGGNVNRERQISDIETLFDETGAVAALNSKYWKKALDLTDVYEYLPQKRRSQWFDLIHENKTPSFEKSSVYATLQDLLQARAVFLAERVDGIFYGLSREHVTNRPEGFSKRMIISGMFNEYGSADYEISGFFSDLRIIIAKFMGREVLSSITNKEPLDYARYMHGEWVSVDGNALKIRAYLKGTLHIEVHPEMAWRLNKMLAILYPTAIPSSFRSKPKKEAVEVALMSNLIPYPVLKRLSELHVYYEDVSYKQRVTYENTLAFSYQQNGDRYISEKTGEILEAIGGTFNGNRFEFDYDPAPVVKSIIASGYLPDDKSHQFYPTPENLADILVKLADIQSGHSVLEPSAGNGALVKAINRLDENVKITAVDVSDLRCKILNSLNICNNVIHSDFIKYAEYTNDRFDRVVMNPPFSLGRAKQHIESAAKLLTNDGALVAILPSSFANKSLLNGYDEEWSQIYDNEFSGTSISVVMYKAKVK